MSAADNQKFIFRTPLLPLSELAFNREGLLSAFRAPAVREALFIASKDLYAELLNLERGEVPDKERTEKIFTGLYKYYTRMCTRSTPFGTFAGLNIGSFSDHTEIRLGKGMQPKLRLDMDYLCNLFYELNKDSSLYKDLHFYPNNSLYKVRDQWRYVEYQFRENTMRFHNLVSIDDNEVLSELLAQAAGGCSYDGLLATIAGYGFDEEEAGQYITELVRSQVLVSDLYPSITGEEYQSRLFRALEKLPGERFAGIHNDLNRLFESDGDIIRKTAETEAFLSRFGVRINSNHLIQIDLLKEPEACSLERELVLQIDEVTGILMRLIKNQKKNSLLQRFRRAYQERYEDVFMPLVQVMDTDIGIGYRNAVSISGNFTDQSPSAVEKEIRALKMRLYIRALKEHTSHVELKEEDMIPFRADSPDPMSPSYFVMGNLLYDEQGKSLFRYKTAGGTSAIGLLGRFGHLHPAIEELCISFARDEAAHYHPAILAEIAHLPEGRIGNVVTRPHYRDFEIPYLSHSTMPADRQIDVSDLYIGVMNNRVVLFSKKLNREVIPRLGNAHNFQADSLPVYHFLCDLQGQDITPGTYWSWDELYDEAFLPRVSYKNIILSPAQWSISTEPFKKMDVERDSALFCRMKEELGLPDEILISQGDNELYVDLRSSLGVLTFLRACRKSARLVLHEFLYKCENAPDGYSNEVIIPYFAKGRPAFRATENVRVSGKEDLPFGPLSEWLYFKLYTGKKYAEKLLTDLVPELVRELKDHDVITKWFFIRYSDPKDHIRLRFLIRDKDKRDLLFAIADKYLRSYLDDHIIWDFQIGTYRREMDRYGLATMEESESWFCRNSELVLELLPVFRSLTLKEQVAAAIYCTDHLIGEFGYGLSARYEFAQFQSELYNREFGVANNKALRQSMNDEFRNIHPLLKQLFGDNGISSNASLERVRQICREEGPRLLDLNGDLVKNSGGSGPPTSARLGSFIHMFINRLFKEGQRYKEMTIYYLMTKYYASEVARSKFDPGKKATPTKQAMLMAFLFSLLLTAAGRSYGQKDMMGYVQQHTAPIYSIDPDSVNYHDLQALGSAIGDAKVVMLGEQDHGDAPTFLAKTRIIKYLHEEKGFNVLAFESDFFGLNYRGDHTERNAGGIDSIIKRNVYPLWTNCHTCRQLFKDYIPSTFTDARPLEIAGFDPQMGPKYLFPQLDSELRRLQLPVTLSPQYTSEILPAMKNWAKNVKDSALNNQYLGYLLRIRKELSEKLPADDFWLLVIDNLVAQDREYQRLGSDYWGTLNTRDRQMALNLEWLNTVRYKNEKIIVWAANYHISKYSGHYPGADSFMNAGQTMGTIFTSDQGVSDKTYILGFTSYEGTAGRLYGPKQYAVSPPQRNSFENWIGKEYDYAFVDFKSFNARHPEEKAFFMSGAVKGNWYHKNSAANWNKIFDGVFFIRKMYPCEKMQ